MMRKSITTVIFLIAATCSLYAQTDTVKERFVSRLYFPALIGLNIPFDNDNTVVKNGSVLNTAVEFRPTYINAFFFRLNYDVLSNKYNSSIVYLPTNVGTGKVSTSFFLLGAGYRWRVNNIGVYALIQPGLGTRSFNKALLNADGVAIDNVSDNSFTIKTSAGIEFYIVRHFALIAEPSFYKLFARSGFNNTHSQVAGISVGFTTTLF
jgi:hypothetical protein